MAKAVHEILEHFRQNRPCAHCGRIYSLKDISDGTGLDKSHVSRIFNGENVPTTRTIVRILAYMDVEFAEFNSIMESGK